MEETEEAIVEQIRNRYSDFMSVKSIDNRYIESGKELLEEIRHSGQRLSDPDNRNLVAQMARDVGETLFELTGDYLPVRLEIPQSEFYGTVGGRIHTGSGRIYNIIIDYSLRSQVEQLFRWSEAPPHMRTSWAGWVIWSMSAVFDRLTSQTLLAFNVAVALWIVTAWLITPILQWPLDDSQVRLMACIRAAIASLAVPLLVSSFTQADRQSTFQLTTRRGKGTLWLLKITGATVGFGTFFLVLMFVSLIVYYLTLSTLPVWTWWILALLPLLFSHIVARRIPADRYQMFDGKLQLHDADPLFLVVFLLSGALMAGFVYFFYEPLAERFNGVVFLLVLIGMALWERRVDLFHFVSPQLVLITIVFIGCMLALFLILSNQTLYATIMIAVIAIGLSLGFILEGGKWLTSGGNKTAVEEISSKFSALLISYVILSVTVLVLVFSF